MSETSAINPARQEQFVQKVVEQISGTMTTLLAAVGDRLGLFKDLAEQGPATSVELASRTNLNERYLREWLGGMFAAGYLSYDDAQQRYALPAEHVPALATEPGPAFFGGVHQELIGAIQRYDQVTAAFRHGGGIRHADLHPDVWIGTSRPPSARVRACTATFPPAALRVQTMTASPAALRATCAS